MKIAVLVKRVPDTASVFTIREDGKSVDLSGLNFVMSPYDEHAVEQGIRLRDEAGGEVIIVCAGPPECKETIRSGLAMGADSGIHITGVEEMTACGLAETLAAALKRLSPDIVFAGKQAVDSDGSQVPESVAELMGVQHASCITKFAFQTGKAIVEREVEGGSYRLAVELPALFTAQKSLNTPRYPTLPNIMKAKRKSIEELAVTDLALEAAVTAPGLAVERMSLPRQSRRCTVLEGEVTGQVHALVHALHEDEKVL